MNNDQSFLGGMQPVNNGGVPNNNINDGTVIPGAGLTPVGSPVSSPAPVLNSTPMSSPIPGVSTSILPGSEVMPTSQIAPTTILPGFEVSSPVPGASNTMSPSSGGMPTSTAIPGIITAPDVGSSVAPVVPGIVDASNTMTQPTNLVPTEQMVPNMGLGIVSGNDASSNMAMAPNNNLNSNIVSDTNNISNNGTIGVDAGSVNNGSDAIPGGTSPFDIGLTSATVNTSMGSNSIMVNSGANIVSNSNDSKPFTNESTDINGVGEDLVSVKDYLINIILFSIPVVGLIMILVKAFSKKENKNISNFAKAFLIIQFVMVIFCVAIMVMFPTMLLGVMFSGT